MARLPKLPGPDSIFSVIEKANKALDKGLDTVDKVADALGKFGISESPLRATEAGESLPSIGDMTLTACLQCCRDHWSTISGALSEAPRFARSDSMTSKEVQGRIGVALDEANIMERIDLAPQAVAGLKGEEKKLAEWALRNSRQLRHQIGEIKTLDDLEKAAALAADIRGKYFVAYNEVEQGEECETCGEIQASIRQFVERRKRERE